MIKELMKRSKVFLALTVVIVVMLSMGAGAVVMSILNAQQSNTVDIAGKTVELKLDGVPMANIVMTPEVSSMVAGDYIVKYHYIDWNSTDQSQFTMNITFDKANGWSSNPSHDWYGFTYGVDTKSVGGSTWEENVTKVTLIKNENRIVRLWFRVDPNMVTPMTDVVTHLWINATTM